MQIIPTEGFLIGQQMQNFLTQAASPLDLFSHKNMKRYQKRELRTFSPIISTCYRVLTAATYSRLSITNTSNQDEIKEFPPFLVIVEHLLKIADGGSALKMFQDVADMSCKMREDEVELQPLGRYFFPEPDEFDGCLFSLSLTEDEFTFDRLPGSFDLLNQFLSFHS